MKVTVTFTLAMGLMASSGALAQEAWQKYNQGIRWEKSLEHAQARAEKEGKPILLHQLVGDMDLAGC